MEQPIYYPKIQGRNNIKKGEMSLSTTIRLKYKNLWYNLPISITFNIPNDTFIKKVKRIISRKLPNNFILQNLNTFHESIYVNTHIFKLNKKIIEENKLVRASEQVAETVRLNRIYNSKKENVGEVSKVK